MHIDLLGSWPDLDLILTYLGHDLTLKFWNWSFKVKKYMFRTGSTRQKRWCHFLYFCISYQKVINEKPYQWKMIICKLMTSGAKTIDLRSNLIEKRYGGMKDALQRFFESFLAILEIIALVCEKSRYFLKIWPLVTSGDLSIGQTWKWSRKSLRSCRRLSYAVCRLSLSSVVLEIQGGVTGPQP